MKNNGIATITGVDRNTLFKIVPAFAKQLASTVLLYILGALAVFLLGMACVYKAGLQPLHIPQIFKIVLILLVAAVYGAFSFIYGFVMAALSTLRTVAGITVDFISDYINRLQNSVAGPADKAALDAAILNLKLAYKDNRASAIASALAAFILYFVARSVKKVLLKNIRKGGVTFAKLFAGNAALAAAVFFNLKFILTVLLVCGYVAGAVLLLIPLFLML